jgi:hypothetical protein
MRPYWVVMMKFIAASLDSDTAMLLPVFVLRLSPVIILCFEEMTQSFTAALFHW